MASVIYPASPTNLPRKLTGLSATYTAKAILAIVAIILFFALYITLVIALGYLFYLSVIFDIGAIGLYPILAKLGAMAGAGMLLFFTIKFLFKLKNPAIPNRIKLPRNQYPELWAFVERICEETGAPLPKSIYVDPDVNAYVRYTNLWLSLFLPVRKELTIGLGLVNCLNLSQFKGVIAHEFGHFSQRSMKIGSYIASANTIIHDMIFARDKWDELFAKWKTADFRLSIAAWLITPIIGLIRQVLRLFYSFLNIMYSSLSREMEFNADKVAVTVAGSDAIVSALWNLENRYQFWNSTVNHAYMATQKEMYSRNLYEQHVLSQARTEQEYLARLQELPADERGGRKYFSSSENSKVSMYESHPPNDQREASAKNPYVPCPVDERSPWVLFTDPEKLQEEMTLLLYETYLQKTPENFVETADFQRFVDGELEGKEFAEVYENTFADRFPYLPDSQEIEASSINEMEIADGLQFLGDEIKRLMEPVKDIASHMERVQAMAAGKSREKVFEFNNVSYSKKELSVAWTALQRRREELFGNYFVEWDTAFLALHLKIADKVGKRERLLQIYAQYYAITKVHRQIVGTYNRLMSEVTRLQQQEQVEQKEITRLRNYTKQTLREVNHSIADLKSLNFIPLPNIDTIEELQHAIIEDGKIVVDSGPMFEEGRFDRAMHGLKLASYHCQRINEKCTAQILQFHTELQKEYQGDSTPAA